MKNLAVKLVLIIITTFVISCKNVSDNIEQPVLKVNFQYGEDLTPVAYKNIYAIWIENEESSFIQNICICKKLIKGGLTGTALPYWKINKYPDLSGNEVDAVTSATKANSDFEISAFLKNDSIRKFTVYLEMDRAFEPNDWFIDQPALLYSVDIDLDSNIYEYELTPLGWTPNEITENVIPNTPKGQLNKELRYITNHKDELTFGLTDERSATKMVRKIAVRIE